MSIIREMPMKEVLNFGGAWLLPDPPMVDLRGALKSQNVEFSAGSVATRHGFAPVTDFALDTGSVTALGVWTAPVSQIASTYSDTILLRYGTDLPLASPAWQMRGECLKQPGSAGVISLTIDQTDSPRGMSFVGVGMRGYFVFYSTAQRGTTNGNRIITLYNNAGALAYSANNFFFPGPLSYNPGAPTEPLAGNVSAGVHRLAYIIEYDTGFTGRVSPDTSTSTVPDLTTFTPVSVTASGAKNLSWTLNPGGSGSGWPNGAVAVSVLMTTATNPNQYYLVPGSRTAVTTGGGGVTITISISDADLSSQSLDGSKYLYKLTASSTGLTVPFNPAHIALLGDRMAYLAILADNKSSQISALYISERNDYQSITADQHVVQLPGQASMTTMFHMGGRNYVLGPHEIWALTDTGDVPATWPAPQLVDGQHGTLAVHGVEVSPSNNYAWIADQSGLYLFDGSPMTALPVSYQQTPDWNRINWNVAWCLRVKDHASQKKVVVVAALDGASTPSHMLTWDYTNGLSSDSVRYSLDAIASYALSDIAIVQNDLSTAVAGTAKRLELWASTTGNGYVLRQKTDSDATPWRDTHASSVAINSIYRTAPLPGRDAALPILQHHGFHARLKGAGAIVPVVYDMDAQRSFTCRSQTLATSPDKDYLFLADMRSELAYVEFNTNTVDTHWTLSTLKWYYSPYLMQR